MFHIRSIFVSTAFENQCREFFYKFIINIDATEMNFWPRISSDYDGRLLEWSIL